MPGWGYYNATKFAVEGLSEALSTELAPLGVHVMAVEPGPFRTEFLGRSGVEAKERISDYEPTAGKTREYFQTQSGKQPGDPHLPHFAYISIMAVASITLKFKFDSKRSHPSWQTQL